MDRRRQPATRIGDLFVLTDSPFTKRDFERFGIASLSRTFRVVILDCTSWAKPEFAAKYTEGVFACEGYVAIQDAQSLVRCLEGASSAIAIDYLGDSFASIAVRRELRSRGILRAIVQGGLLPDPVTSLSQKLTRFLRTYPPRSLLRNVLRRVFRRIQTQPPPDLILMSGSAGLDQPGVHEIPHRVWAHSFNFDTYLGMSGAPPAERGAYAVFLDEDVVHHPDYEHSGLRAPATDAYYPAMQRLFAEIEHRYGLKVIVAAHPKSRYDLRPNLWGPYEVILGQTPELVRDARLVLCHMSTSITFAVLWRRPLLFLTSRELDRSYMQPYMTSISSQLNAPVVNIDGEAYDRMPSNFEVDIAAYERYRERYIKRAASPELPAWEIFAAYVQRELQPSGALNGVNGRP